MGVSVEAPLHVAQVLFGTRAANPLMRHPPWLRCRAPGRNRKGADTEIPWAEKSITVNETPSDAVPAMTQINASIQSIYRYPVKGLSPEGLDETRLEVGRTLPADRAFAIENGPSGFDPAAPAYFPKQRFLMLMKNERLARLDTQYDDASGVLTIRTEGGEPVRGNIATAAGRKTIEDFFAVFCADELRGPPRVLQADGHSFSDVAAKVVSIINLASVAATETATGAAVHPLRFRANLYIDGWPAWHEFDLLGRELAIGPSARVRITKRIVRCAATNVDPDTGMRDLAIPQTLMQTFGHMDCGVYGQVIAAGPVAVGDRMVEG
jgi:uncharacterized protein